MEPKPEQHILLVDDEPGIRTVLGIALEDTGYTVHTAESGETALALFRRHAPAIVLTDIKMPGMDGIELLQHIKRADPETEVIMITGHGDMDLAIKSLKYEATDFITKPINDDALEIALRRARERISMRRQLKAYTETLEAMVEEKSARLIEAERLAAVGQAVEGLISAFGNLAADLEGGIRYFNEMPCFVAIHNRELKVVAANELYKERLGKASGAPSGAIYHDGGRDCPAAQTFASGEGQRRSATIIYRDGSQVPVVVHTAPIRSQDGGVKLVLEICADIAEVKRLQEELKATRRRFQQLFDEVPCYISVQDRQMRVTATNRRFKEDFGETVDAPCYELYKHRAAPCPDCPVAKTFADGQSHQSEMVVTARSGEQYNVLVWTAPIRDADGQVDQVMEMSTNITQIRQLQDHLSSLGLLIGSISHGIKGLLTGLDGGMYLVEAGFAKENQDQIQEGWEVVKMMVSRIRSMVLDILYYAKERELEWERINAIAFAEDVARTFAAKLHDAPVQLETRFDAAAGDFEVDAGVVRSALINILDNALDACRAEGAKASHTIIFGVKQHNNQIVFDVIDNGIGMDRDTCEKLFTLFFSSKGKGGTGLGLYISNRIIQQHGGSITVRSTPAEGSHFTVRMPTILPEEVKSPPPGSANATGRLTSIQAS